MLTSIRTTYLGFLDCTTLKFGSVVDIIAWCTYIYLGMASNTKPKRTRSAPEPDIDFPSRDVASWISSGDLPNYLEVIGAVKYNIEQNFKNTC